MTLDNLESISVFNPVKEKEDKKKIIGCLLLIICQKTYFKYILTLPLQICPWSHWPCFVRKQQV